MCKDVVIVGASGHARVIADTIFKSNDRVVGFLDDNINNTNIILGKIDDYYKYIEKYFIIAIGDNNIRKKISEKLKNVKYYKAIHPNAVIAEGVEIGEGTVVLPNAVINSNAKVGKHTIINTAAIVEHDNTICDFVHISPNATLCGNVKIADLTHIGAGALVKNNINICDNVVVGMGSVVLNSIDSCGVYIGCPAKLYSKNN
jgi:sugar O-acyltransferase (sialic acid O-acetyltransferase NeuD family)